MQVRSSDLKAYEYAYDVDGQLVEVLENGQSTWRYQTDADGNLIRVTHYARPRSISIDQRGIVESVGDVSYVHDADGFLTKRGDSETFEYDSHGRLTRVHRSTGSSGSGSAGPFDVRYHYDGLGRLAVRHETTSGSGTTTTVTITQYFYADLNAWQRITHVHHSTSSTDGATSSARGGTIIRCIYDGHGKLFAMQRSSRGNDIDEIFYVGLDPFDTPIVVLNGVGSVVKQLTYDPLGACLADTASDFDVLVFGFRGLVADPTVRLMLTVDGLAYDPAIGRYTMPRYGHVIANAGRLPFNPEVVGLLYRNNMRSSIKESPMIGQYI